MLDNNAEEYIKRLSTDCLQHKIFECKLLMDMVGQKLNRDQLVNWFGQQIYLSRQFPRCIAILYGIIPDETISSKLVTHFLEYENYGSSHPDSHPKLLNLTIDWLRENGHGHADKAQPFRSTRIFLDSRLRYCLTEDVPKVLGAFAFGTELVNTAIFDRYRVAMSIFEGIPLEYFTSHVEGEEEDFDILMRIAMKLPKDSQSFWPLMQQGAEDMLNMRLKYFNGLSRELSY